VRRGKPAGIGSLLKAISGLHATLSATSSRSRVAHVAARNQFIMQPV